MATITIVVIAAILFLAVEIIDKTPLIFSAGSDRNFIACEIDGEVHDIKDLSCRKALKEDFFITYVPATYTYDDLIIKNKGEQNE